MQCNYLNLAFIEEFFLFSLWLFPKIVGQKKQELLKTVSAIFADIMAIKLAFGSAGGVKSAAGRLSAKWQPEGGNQPIWPDFTILLLLVYSSIFYCPAYEKGLAVRSKSAR